MIPFGNPKIHAGFSAGGAVPFPYGDLTKTSRAAYAVRLGNIIS